MDQANILILIAAALVAASILASAFATRAGTPLLLVFLLLGMLAGEDGPGGIHFDDIETAYLIGSVALGIILFDGGMRTRAENVTSVLWPGITLATVGVVITAVVIAAFARFAFGFNWLQGLLLGAIVGSTDAAAVFSLLNARGLALKRRVSATLELESGSNDPMAVFLTIVMVDALAAGKSGLDWTVLWQLVKQLTIGAALGYLGGALMVKLINRLNLAPAMYPLLASALALVVFGAAAVSGGSGFLAIYIAGLILGNRDVRSSQNILRVHDGLAWLAQIVMFLVLGLLATPSELLPLAGAALATAGVLIFAARPLAVLACLAPFRFPLREQLYIGWVGLRGAVPIILGIFPLIAGIEDARLYFNVAFFVVLVSLLVQGWTVAVAARLARLEVPPESTPLRRFDIDISGHWDLELLCYALADDSPALQHGLRALPLPDETSVAAVVHEERLRSPNELVKLAAGDQVYLITSARNVDALNRLFIAPHHPDRLEEHRFFGDLVLEADAELLDVAAFYGLELPPEAPGLTLGDYLHRAFHERASVGDRIKLGRVALVVREMEGGRITKVGLKFR